MKEHIVTMHTATLAKEKGFNWPVYDSYVKGKLKPNTLHNGYDWNNDTTLKGRISAPTQALLSQWLLDVHYISIDIISHKYTVRPLSLFDRTYRLKINEEMHSIVYRSRSAAMEVALQIALNLL